MTNWIKTVPVNNLINSFRPEGDDEVPNTSIPALATALVELLDREMPAYMKDYGEALREMAIEEDEEYMSIDEFDYELSGLYDYADICKIWMGI